MHALDGELSLDTMSSVQPTAPPSLGDELKRAIGWVVSQAFAKTPRVLHPAVAVALIAVQATVTAFLTVAVLNLLLEKEHAVDVQLLAGLTMCALTSALAIGIVREFVGLPERARPWILSFIAACTFWLAVII